MTPRSFQRPAGFPPPAAFFCGRHQTVPRVDSGLQPVRAFSYPTRGCPNASPRQVATRGALRVPGTPDDAPGAARAESTALASSAPLDTSDAPAPDCSVPGGGAPRCTHLRSTVAWTHSEGRRSLSPISASRRPARASARTQCRRARPGVALSPTPTRTSTAVATPRTRVPDPRLARR